MGTLKQITTHLIFSSVLMLTASVCVIAQQNTVSIAISEAVDLTFVQPSEVGNSVLQVTNESNWLNYNISLTSGKKHAIMVQLESALAVGIELTIEAGTFQGTWGGGLNVPNRRGTNYTDDPAGDSPGTAVPAVTLSLIPQMLVGDIGCFNTGTGTYVGHKLTYIMRISDYSAVRATSSNVNVLYTISEQL